LGAYRIPQETGLLISSVLLGPSARETLWKLLNDKIATVWSGEVELNFFVENWGSQKERGAKKRREYPNSRAWPPRSGDCD
jgi:hypothetical protein